MERPNLLVLLTDQQGAATVEPESPCLLPNVDRIASEGARFSRCYASNPICSPSRASLFTGVLPHVHGMVNVTHGVEPYAARFRDELETWSERLDEAGYRTGYFGKWHVERSGELERFGFDEYEIFRSAAYGRNFADYRRERGLDPDRDPTADPDDARWIHDEGYEDFLVYGVHDEPEGTSERYVYDRGIEFVRDAAERDEPWALVLSTYGPHDPYVPPRECYERYDPAAIPKPASFHDPMRDKPTIYRRQREVWDDLSWSEFAEATAHYYAYCSHIDDQIGRLRAVLADTGQDDETAIVHTADHGDYMGAHGLLLKGLPAFEEAYRVPLVIRWPGEKAEIVRDDPVQLHDVGPTILELVGIEDPFPRRSRLDPRNPHARGGANIQALTDPPSFRARSLVPFLRDERPDGYVPEAYAEFHGQDFGWTQRVYWHEDGKYVFNTFDRDESYDLEADPQELLNVAEDPEYEETVKELAGRMWEIARETGDYAISELHYGMHRFAPVGPNDPEE